MINLWCFFGVALGNPEFSAERCYKAMYIKTAPLSWMCVSSKWLWFFRPELLFSSFAHLSTHALLFIVSDLSKNWFTQTPDLSNLFLPPTFSVNTAFSTFRRQTLQNSAAKNRWTLSPVSMVGSSGYWPLPCQTVFPGVKGGHIGSTDLGTGHTTEVFTFSLIWGLRYHFLHSMLYQFIKKKLCSFFQGWCFAPCDLHGWKWVRSIFLFYLFFQLLIFGTFIYVWKSSLKWKFPGKRE